MVYDQPTQVTLECPQCRSYKTIPRRRDIPFAVRVIELLCSECVFDETEPHIERWFSAPGIQLPQDMNIEPLFWPCSDCPPIGYPTDKTRCRGCLSDPDRLREDRDERRRIFGEFKTDLHLSCELDSRIASGVVEDLSRTLNQAVKLLTTLLASAHRNERDYMPSEWHEAVDEAKEFIVMIKGNRDEPIGGV